MNQYAVATYLGFEIHYFTSNHQANLRFAVIIWADSDDEWCSHSVTYEGVNPHARIVRHAEVWCETHPNMENN